MRLCRLPVRLAVFSVLASAAILAAQTSPPAPPPAGAAPARGGRGAGPSANEARALAEEFRGITTDGTVQPGLFPIRSSGVSTAPVQQGAAAFLTALTPAQKARTLFPVDDLEWRKWMNVHRYVRQGVSFDEMTEGQRTAAFALLKASLSAKGLQLSRDIMKLNHTLGELNNNNFTEYGEWLYWITIMGEPSATKPWGWQLDGHHLIINYFVLGDQVVMSPVFVGSEPVIAASGKYQGTKILQEEQNRGLAFFRSLDAGQRQKAVISAEKPGNNNQAEGFKDNVVVPYAGLPVSALTPVQQRDLLALAELFIGNQAQPHAQVRMSEIRAHIDRTYFAWVGGSDDTSVFYFRIHSPVVLIEFDHQRPANLRHLAANPQLPNREHIHVTIRTPNGNDYGKDLLRQHLQQHKH